MKLKKIASMILAVATVASSTVFTYAADEVMTVGAPINLETGLEVETLEAGDMIAVPMIATANDGTSYFDSVIAYDTEVLTPGLTVADESDNVYNNMDALGVIYSNDDTTVDLAISGMYTVSRGNKVQFGDSPTLNPAYGADEFYFGWVSKDGTKQDISSYAVHAYYLFTVQKAVDAEQLNFSVAKMSSNGNSINSNRSPIFEETKLNATQGAFKVVLDSAALPNGNWVQGLYAQVGDAKQDITACVHADGTTTYEFPVRVNSATGATDSITADIYANVTADEAGNTTVSAKKVGSVTLTMDGTVTSYNVVNGTVAE